MRDDDQKRPGDTTKHRIGEALDTLSIDELDARIALLSQEIARIEAARVAKTAALEQAGSIFRR